MNGKHLCGPVCFIIRFHCPSWLKDNEDGVIRIGKPIVSLKHSTGAQLAQGLGIVHVGLVLAEDEDGRRGFLEAFQQVHDLRLWKQKDCGYKGL